MRGTLRVSGFIILIFVLAGCASQSDNTSAPLVSPTQHSNQTLTSQEYAFARTLARSKIRSEGATVTSATVTVSAGKVIDSNVGEPCTSGRLLNIKLIGNFPHIVISPAVSPGTSPRDTTITALLLTADAKTGRPCLVGVHIGKTAPEPGAVILSVN